VRAFFAHTPRLGKMKMSKIKAFESVFSYYSLWAGGDYRRATRAHYEIGMLTSLSSLLTKA
jgi:hypothetical protein